MPRPLRTSSLAVGTALTCAVVACSSAPDREAAPLAQDRIDASERTTCWLLDGGALRCAGMVLRGTSDPEDGAFLKVSVGGDVACGLREDGTARCFVGWVGCAGDGCILGGEIFVGSGGSVRHDLPGEFIDVDVLPSGAGALALDRSGKVLRFDLDRGTAEFSSLDDAFARAGGAPEGFVRIAGNDFQACGVRSTGRVTCWQLSAPDHRYDPPGSFAALSAGSTHLCALPMGTPGAVHCWGGNEGAQASDVEGRFRAISAGDDSTCALGDDGGARCWGDGSATPTPAPEGPFVAVAAGGGHRCGLRDDDTTTCWGFGPGLPVPDWGSDAEGTIAGVVGGCTLIDPTSEARFACELDRGYLSGFGLSRVNATEFVQMFGATKQRNIWIAGPDAELPGGGSVPVSDVYGAIDPGDPGATLLAPIPVGTVLIHENPGGDRYELMTKLPEGAAPENGDWGFSRHLLDGTRVPLLQPGSG